MNYEYTHISDVPFYILSNLFQCRLAQTFPSPDNYTIIYHTHLFRIANAPSYIIMGNLNNLFIQTICSQRSQSHKDEGKGKECEDTEKTKVIFRQDGADGYYPFPIRQTSCAT